MFKWKKHLCNICILLRIKRIKFDFILGAFYHTSAIEYDNAVKARFFLEILMNNELHSGHIHVEAKLKPTLSRFCNGGLKRYTMLDVVVVILLILATVTYVYAIFTSLKLSRVC